MKKEYKDLMPKWAFTKQDRNLCLTNDLDSLFLTGLLKDEFDYEINHFYNFHRFATLNVEDKRMAIGVDLALKEGFTYCNHLTMIDSNSYKNKDSVNMNNILNIGNDQYHKKFNLSSLITAWSLYDRPLPESEFGRMVLLTIDSAYMGYRKPEYKHIMVEWLERLEMLELVELLKKYSQSEFLDFQNKNHLNADIVMNKEGYLRFNYIHNSYTLEDEKVDLEYIGQQLGFNIELPTKQFTLIGRMEQMYIGVRDLHSHYIKRSMNMVFTYKDKIAMSLHKL